MTSPRALLLLTAVAAAFACGDGRRTSGAAQSGIGPDAVLLRVPEGGGTARAYRVGSDSVLWQAEAPMPALGTLLGFDEYLGVLLAQDRQGRVASVDLRLGTVDALSEERLNADAVSEGAAVFGLDAKRQIARITSVAAWQWAPPEGARALIPLPDGSLVVLSGSDSLTLARRVFPPETVVTDSIALPGVRLIARTMAGDRIWFVTDSGLISVRTREFERAFTLRLRDSIVAMAPTPSGDRVFLATDGDRVRVVDRYAERQRDPVEVPMPVSELRMDPDGRYLLAKLRDTDSVYVISIGTNRVVNTLATAWRSDLPVVTPEGRILLLQGDDANLVDAESGRARFAYARGASDRWMLVRWNGFRPRAAGLDRPVEFEEFAADSAAADSALTAMIAARYGDLSSIGRAAPVTAAPTPMEPSPSPTPAAPILERREEPERGTFTVSFATLLDGARAQAMADSIVVDGRHARVVPGDRDGVPVYRVLLGPFETRRQAERAGMASRLSYWVFEGTP